jgi:endonuclease/exonuclease/phosphatase family metal-dependent hydrolase
VLVTWNLQGAAGVDVALASAALLELAEPWAPDLVVLQEVQRRQAEHLAQAFGFPHQWWAFKHWPVVHPAEGLAVLSRFPLTRSAVRTLRWAPFWSWRRRVALATDVLAPAGQVTVVNVHLSPHDLAAQRHAEAAAVVRLAGTGATERTCLVGDLNDVPGGASHAAFLAAGWTDVWTRRPLAGAAPPPAAGSDGATNWSDSGAREGRPPDQRLDYVLVPAGWAVVQATVPAGDPGPPGTAFDRWARLSDHLPVMSVVQPPTG